MARYAKTFQSIDEKRVLKVLERYYRRNEISFERAASEAGTGVYLMIEYIRKHKLPIVWTEIDRAEGLRKVKSIMNKMRIKTQFASDDLTYHKLLGK